MLREELKARKEMGSDIQSDIGVKMKLKPVSYENLDFSPELPGIIEIVKPIVIESYEGYLVKFDPKFAVDPPFFGWWDDDAISKYKKLYETQKDVDPPLLRWEGYFWEILDGAHKMRAARELNKIIDVVVIPKEAFREDEVKPVVYKLNLDKAMIFINKKDEKNSK